MNLNRWAASVAALSCALSTPAISDTSVAPDASGFAFLAVSTCGSVDFSGAATNGKFRPGTIDATGKLCTSAVGGSGGGGGAVYGPTAEGTAPAQPPIYNGYKDSAGQTRGVSPSTPLPALPYDVRSGAQTLSSASGQTVDIPLNGTATVGFRFSGLAASGATLSFFTSNDGGTTYSTKNTTNCSTGQGSPTYNVDGQPRLDVSGATNLRVQVTAGGSGSISYAYNLSAAPLACPNGPIPPGANSVGSIFGPDADGATTTKPGVLNATRDATGKAQTVSPTNPMPASEADGANIALGAKADAASCASGQSAMACFRQLHADLLAVNPTGGVGTLSQPADVSCAANTVCTLSSQTSRKFWAATNTTGSGFCRVGYGITPTASRGDPLASANVTGSQGGARTFETTFVPQGTISAICTVASTIAVMEVN